MPNYIDDGFIRIDRRVAEHFVSNAVAGRENGEYVSADVLSDPDSVSGFVLKVWVYSECALEVRPRADGDSAVVLRIRGNNVYGLAEIEVPARCFIAERGSDGEHEGCDPGMMPVKDESIAQRSPDPEHEEHDPGPEPEDPLTSYASIRGCLGEAIAIEVSRDNKSTSGFALEVQLACGRTIIVRPRDDGGKLVGLRLREDFVHAAYEVVEVEMPKHVIARPDTEAESTGTHVHF